MRICLAAVGFAALFVPRYQRRDWRREWRAEIWHRGTRSAEVELENDLEFEGNLRVGRRRRPSSRGSDLIRRSFGAFRHAAWLRSQEWKPDMVMQDVRYAIRSLLRAPTFTIMALATLGVGIGAVAVVFDMIDSVLLRPYPFERAEQLVEVRGYEIQEPDSQLALSYPTYLAIREARVFDEIAVWDWEPMNLRTDEETVFIGVGQVTASLFKVLRAEPILGRAFLPEEDLPGRNDVAILSEGIWKERFGGDQDVIGETIVLDGRRRVIVGVMPHEYGYPDEIRMWVPIGLTVETSPASRTWLGSLARMRDGTSMEQTSAMLVPLAERLREEHLDANRDRGLTIAPLREARVGEVQPLFLILFAAVGFLLLIVCANVANLMLARASSREREISVRLALGAGRGRLVRQLLTESLLLALGGLALGFAFSRWASGAIFDLVPLELPVWIVIETSFTEVAFMASIAVAAAIMFGLVPALQATRPDVRGALADGSGHTAGSRRRRLTRNALVVAEVSISLMLLAGAGLMARSFFELSRIDPGFETEGRLTGTMQMPRGKYTSGEMQVAFHEQMLARVAALPGIERVGVVSRIPMRGSSNANAFIVEGQGMEEAGRNPFALNSSVSPEYFRTMGIELLHGRVFDFSDTRGSTPVVIINDVFAERYFPDGDAIGSRMGMSHGGDDWWEIVGVVGSVRHYALDTPAQLQFYRPYAQVPTGRLSLVAQTRGDPAAQLEAIRSEVRAIDPDQALYDLMPLETAVAESIWMGRFFSQLMGVFAAIAALVAAVGIYGVTSYSISRRTHELGVRMALGAQRPHIVRMVVRQSMAVVAIGVVIGLGMAFLQGAVIASFLYGISGTDVVTYGAVTALIVAVSLLAAWLPARRATGLDPVRALRDE